VRQFKDNKFHPVHFLNGTLCATGRTMSILLELNQTSDGVRIPDILKKYMFRPKNIIPYIKT